MQREISSGSNRKLFRTDLEPSNESYCYNFVRNSSRRIASHNHRSKGTFIKGGEKKSCESFEEIFTKRNLSIQSKKKRKESFDLRIKHMMFQPSKPQKNNISFSYSMNLKLRRTVTTQPIQQIKMQQNTANVTASDIVYTDCELLPILQTKSNETKPQPRVILSNKNHKKSPPTTECSEDRSQIKMPSTAGANENENDSEIVFKPFLRHYSKENVRKETKVKVKRKGIVGNSYQLKQSPYIHNYVNEMMGRMSQIGKLDNDYTPWQSDDEFERCLHNKKLR